MMIHTVNFDAVGKTLGQLEAVAHAHAKQAFGTADYELFSLGPAVAEDTTLDRDGWSTITLWRAPFMATLTPGKGTDSCSV